MTCFKLGHISSEIQTIGAITRDKGLIIVFYSFVIGVWYLDTHSNVFVLICNELGWKRKIVYSLLWLKYFI